jgi:gamma-glutamyl:cysteine ligase YbdK (ATP-grasp superfamily)
MPIKNFVLRRVTAYKEEALQHNFDEAEGQLALLRTLLSHFPHEQLECRIEGLEAVLRASRETKRLVEESIRQNMEEIKREAEKKASEEKDRALKQQAEQFEREIKKMKKKEEKGCCTIS